MIAAYLGAYATAYACRTPAGNLAYFVWSDVRAVDRVLQTAFAPLYQLHWRAFDGQRHNDDRPPLPAWAGC